MVEKLVSSLVLETIAHATEDLGKVKIALLNLLPPDLRKYYHGKVKIQELIGFHGNPISLLKLYITKQEHAQLTLINMLSGMEDFDLNELINTLSLRLDSSSNLYIRFDKQAAYLGKLRIMQGDDVIKVRVSFLPHIRGLEKVKYAILSLRSCGHG